MWYSMKMFWDSYISCSSFSSCSYIFHTSFIHLSAILKKEQKRDVLVISHITRIFFLKILLLSEPVFIWTGWLFSGLLYWNVGGPGGGRRFEWSSHYSFLSHCITCTCFACICFNTLSRSFKQVEYKKGRISHSLLVKNIVQTLKHPF